MRVLSNGSTNLVQKNERKKYTTNIIQYFNSQDCSKIWLQYRYYGNNDDLL